MSRQSLSTEHSAEGRLGHNLNTGLGVVANGEATEQANIGGFLSSLFKIRFI